MTIKCLDNLSTQQMMLRNNITMSFQVNSLNGLKCNIPKKRHMYTVIMSRHYTDINIDKFVLTNREIFSLSLSKINRCDFENVCHKGVKILSEY